jgi:hypothetical protein
MSGSFSRRNLFQLAGAAAGAMLGSRYAWANKPLPQAQIAKPPRDGNRLHPDIDLMLKWRGPMEELPVNLGWLRPMSDHYLVDV